MVEDYYLLSVTFSGDYKSVEEFVLGYDLVGENAVSSWTCISLRPDLKE